MPRLSTGLQAGGGPLQVQVSEDGTRAPGAGLEGTQQVQPGYRHKTKQILVKDFLDTHYLTNGFRDQA